MIRRDAENTVLKVPAHVSGCGDLFVKVYELKTTAQKAQSVLRLRKSGWRDLRVSRRLKEAGIDVPDPVGAGSTFCPVFAPWQSLFANRWLDDALSVRDAVVEARARRQNGENMPCRSAAAAENLSLLCQSLGQYIRELHDKGIATSDLNAGNIMLRSPKAGEFHFILVDYERITFRRRVLWKQRLTNLAQMAAFMCVAAPEAVADLARGYNLPHPVAPGQLLTDALHRRTGALSHLWKNREDENFAAISRYLQKRS